MLQPEPSAQQNYRLPSQTVPLFPNSADRASAQSDRFNPHRANPHHSPAAAPIVFPLTRSMPQSIPQPESPPKKRRRRGLVLTEQGWQKLLQAEVVYNQFGERYTFAELSERTLLDPRTVCRIISRDEAVDKRSLKFFFEAFNLKLEKEDYTSPNIEIATARENQNVTLPPDIQPLTSSESQLSAKRLTIIRQRIMEDCCLLMLLLGLENIGQTTLSVTLEPETQPRMELSVQFATLAPINHHSS